MKNAEELKLEWLEEIEFNYFQTDPEGFKKFKIELEQYASIKVKEIALAWYKKGIADTLDEVKLSECKESIELFEDGVDADFQDIFDDYTKHKEG